MNTETNGNQTDSPDIPGFEIKEEIGAGSIGTVYRAVQESLDREVALKILSPRWANYNNYVRRFVREARMLAQLDNPNIVRAYDLGQHDRLFYIVMEFVEGPTLRDLIGEEGHPDILITTSAGIDVCKALSYADNMGIVHRDVKPANIMMPPDIPSKLCDLGHARLRGKEDRNDPFGTPYYTAPEQIEGTEENDIRSDIYSLGGSLYHYLTGQPPFPGDDVNDVLSAHLNKTLTPIRDLNPDVPRTLSNVIEKMLRKKPEHRFEYPKKCREALEEIHQNVRKKRRREEDSRANEEKSPRDSAVMRKLRRFRRGR